MKKVLLNVFNDKVIALLIQNWAKNPHIAILVGKASITFAIVMPWEL